MEKEMTIDERLEALEELLEKMEDEDLPLEESLKLFEQGVKIVRTTQEALSGIEEKLKVLTGGDAEDDV